MAVSEEQAIRNVTYNEGIKSYSSLDHDAGNDEQICTEYRARLEDTTDLLKRIERAAAAGKPVPKDLKPPEAMLYYMLLGVYAAYQAGRLTKEQGHNKKNEAYAVYKRMLAEYEQFREVAASMQRKIRDGYSIGGKTIIPKEESTDE